MKPINRHKGKVAPLDMVNVDTDQIIPKQFLKRIERTGYGKFLFYDWRFNEDGSINTSFILNKEKYKNSSILVTGDNFGSGSSREHAPWALGDYGFQIIIAPSFADIFYNNCFQNGLLPIVLNKEIVKKIINKTTNENEFNLNIDLESQMIWDDTEEISINFDIEEFRKYCLLNGLDDIGLTLNEENKIKLFEDQRSKTGGVI
ncbi:MAG: 3-isopropylmalate dehydratase small subunit [Chloroflexi bacterium]|nr:3-isopropylmalate dehydratase small subunit [Chloroflexota bacterium]|tara:strand:- start:495 stop:1103 length:609 start_codon:yes stop_codon:yes gene_type:complete